jgi:pilin isopeptide linkage protein
MGTLIEEEIEVTFINRKVLREIPVEKLWELQGREIELPEYITIQLLANDVIIETVRIVPDEDDNWKHLFVVPKYDRYSEEIIYTVVELPMPGWRKHLTVDEGVVTITNTVVSPVTVGLEVEKQIIGDTPQVSKAFEFNLRAVDNNFLPDETRAFITGAGRARFGEIIFTQEGTFSYTVHELIPTDTGNYTYDTSVYHVTIVVTMVDGAFVISKTILREEVEVTEIVFVNRYDMYRPWDPPEEPPQERPPHPPDEPPTGRPPTRPEDPPSQRPPTHPEAPGAPDRVPQTGDAMDVNLWIVLGVLSLVFITVYVLTKLRDKHKLKRWS